MSYCVYSEYLGFFFFFKQKTAYEMRISDWSSDVCSSDLSLYPARSPQRRRARGAQSRQSDVPGDPRAEGCGARGGRAHRCRARSVHQPRPRRADIGRASCRERVCQYVSISVVAVSVKKKIKTNIMKRIRRDVNVKS